MSRERLRGLTVRVDIETSKRDLSRTFEMGDDESLSDMMERATDYVRDRLDWDAPDERTYADGYTQGQADVLGWLANGPPPNDEPLAPIDPRLTAKAALVCLARNLRDAGALCESWRIGYEARLHVMMDMPHDWRPGCGRAWEGGA